MPGLELTPYIWFDGRLIPSEEAKIHVLTHALHYGTSYFEGIRAYACSDGTSAVFRLKEHMKRFVNSGKILRLTCPYDLATMEKAVIDTMVANKMSAGYIRPLAWVGEGPLGVFPGNPVHVIVATWPWGAYLGAEALEMGVRVKTSSFNRIHPNTLMGKAKAGGNYVNSVLAKMEAVQSGYDEALMLDVNGCVSEATGENVFATTYSRPLPACPFLRASTVTRSCVWQKISATGWWNRSSPATRCTPPTKRSSAAPPPR